MARKEESSVPFSQRPVVRIGTILFVLVVVFAFVRQLAIPASFGEFGRYRGADVSEVASRDINFAGGGNSECGQCHQDKLQALSKGEHSSLNCQTCHGPAAKHVKKPDEQSPKVAGSAELCGACHKDIAGRDGQQIKTVQLQTHSGGLECAECHNPHNPLSMLGGSR